MDNFYSYLLFYICLCIRTLLCRRQYLPKICTLFCLVLMSPWYDLRGWLDVKQQLNSVHVNLLWCFDLFPWTLAVISVFDSFWTRSWTCNGVQVQFRFLWTCYFHRTGKLAFPLASCVNYVMFPITDPSRAVASLQLGLRLPNNENNPKCLSSQNVRHGWSVLSSCVSWQNTMYTDKRNNNNK